MTKMRVAKKKIVVYDAESAKRMKRTVEGRVVHHIIVDNDIAYLVLREGDVEHHIVVECSGWGVRVTLGDNEIWGGDLQLDCKVEVKVDKYSKIVEIIIPYYTRLLSHV